MSAAKRTGITDHHSHNAEFHRLSLGENEETWRAAPRSGILPLCLRQSGFSIQRVRFASVTPTFQFERSCMKFRFCSHDKKDALPKAENVFFDSVEYPVL
ncbi:hypothetical protein [Saccharibacillus qingshengii]|uniref:hypothetical protein n=1 Tax=Saccharibacillus qingshengii TaxID=1763540 RepID=UPI0015558805|nr:hypothetical protein [Saccharibacillus qingshengii]